MSRSRKPPPPAAPPAPQPTPTRPPRKALLSTDDVARLLDVSRQTVSNWTLVGCAIGGRVVVLRCRQCGVVAKFKRKWVREFTDACFAARRGEAVAPAAVSPAVKRRAEQDAREAEEAEAAWSR